MKKILNIIIFLITVLTVNAQIGVNTNFEALTNQPLDTRDTLTTLADTASVTWTFPGLLTYAVNVDQYWYFTGAFWKQLQTGGGISDGDKGDISVTNSGATWTIDTGAVSWPKLDEAVKDSIRQGKNIFIAGLGQSNMVGQQSSSTDKTPNPRIRLCNAGGTKTMWNPSNNNPAFQWAKNYVLDHPFDTVNVFFVAQSGVSISAYYDATGALRDTLDSRLSDHIPNEIECVLWLQGESDRYGAGINLALAGPSADTNYYDVWVDSIYFNLSNSYSSFNKNTKWVVATVSNLPNSLYYELSINNAFRRIGVDNYSNTLSCEAYDLATYDDLHFTGFAVDTIGKRMYDAYRNNPFNYLKIDPVVFNAEVDTNFQNFVYEINADDFTIPDTIYQGWSTYAATTTTLGRNSIVLQNAPVDSLVHPSFSTIKLFEFPGTRFLNQTVRFESYNTTAGQFGVMLQVHKAATNANGWLIQKRPNGGVEIFRYANGTPTTKKTTTANVWTGDTSVVMQAYMIGDSIIGIKKVLEDGTLVAFSQHSIPLADRFSVPGGVGFYALTTSPGRLFNAQVFSSDINPFVVSENGQIVFINPSGSNVVFTENENNVIYANAVLSVSDIPDLSELYGVDAFVNNASSQVDTLRITLADGSTETVVEPKSVVLSNAAPTGTAIAKTLVDTAGIDTMYVNNNGAWERFETNALLEATNATGAENMYQEAGTATANEYADYISGVRIPVAQNWKYADTVSVPSGFTFTPNFDIWRNGDGTFATSIDDPAEFRKRYFKGGKAYYVDRVGGNNANTGLSKSQAFSTVAFAISRGDMDVLYIKGGIYPYDGFIKTSRDSFAVIGYDGIAVIGQIEAQKTWTATSMAGVFKTTVVDSLSWVLDMNCVGSMGEYCRMKAAADTTQMATRPGTYRYVSPTLLYVHASDRITPAVGSNIIIVDAGASGLGDASVSVYLENIEHYGRVSLNGTDVYAQKCGFFYSPSNDVFSNTNNSSVFSNCRFGHGINDIIDYDTGAEGIELNCVGKYAGYDFSGADNQVSTAHGASKVITINCDFSLASNETILDVNTNTHRWILGGRFGGTWNRETAFQTYALGVGNASANFAQMWIEGAKVGGNTQLDFYANYGSIYLRNVKINGTTRTALTNGGSILKY